MRLASRTDRWALLLLLLGVACRLLATFPLHVWAADSDSLGSAMVAFRVLEGTPKVFYNWPRLGALESYIHAPFLLLFGVSRAATAFAPLLEATAFLWASWLLYKRLLLPRSARVAFVLVALPSPAVLFWTHLPNGWGLTMLFTATTLLAAAVVVQEGPRPVRGLLLGLSAGLGWWNCMIAAAPIAAAGGWLLFRRRDAVRQVRFLAAGVLGFALGALPWIASNVRYGFPSIRQSQQVRAVGGLSQAASNLGYVLGYGFPELTATNPENIGNPPAALTRGLSWLAAVVYGAAALLAILALGFGDRALLPLWLLAGAIVLLNVFSTAGSTRGLTVRYVLPAWLLIPPLVARLGERLGEGLQKSRHGLFVAPALAVVAFNVAAFPFPGTLRRERERLDREAEVRLLSVLESQGTRVVFGDYWSVYPINFLTRERILGIPWQADTDICGYLKRLPVGSVPWSILSSIPGELESIVTGAALEGTIRDVGRGRRLFLPAAIVVARPPATVLGDLLAAGAAAPSGKASREEE